MHLRLGAEVKSVAMGTYHKVQGVVAVVVGLLGLPGCSQESSPAEAATLLHHPSRHLIHISTQSPSAPAANLTFVVAGRVTPSGDHVVLLDARPPFVKVFRRSGELRAAFLGEGGGPLESHGPTVLAVMGDSLVLVADSDSRLFTFDLDGRLRHHVPVLGIPILSATAACDGEWLLYGPRFHPDGSAARWLHRLPAGTGPERLTSFLESPAASRDMAFGLTYGLVASAGGAVLRHDLGSTPALVSWRCGASVPTVEPLDEGIEPLANPTLRGGAAATRVGAGARMRSGLAALEGALVRAEAVKGGSGGTDRTELTRFRGVETTTRSVPGFQSLLDSRPGVGVLIRTDREDGHVVLVSERDFLSLFGATASPAFSRPRGGVAPGGRALH